MGARLLASFSPVPQLPILPLRFILTMLFCSGMLSLVSLCPPVAINQIFPCEPSSCFPLLYPLILSSSNPAPP